MIKKIIFCTLICIAYAMPTFAEESASKDPSWKSNYLRPDFFENSSINSSISKNQIIDPYSDEISGYLFELHNEENRTNLSANVEAFIEYSTQRGFPLEKIVTGSSSVIFYLKKSSDTDNLLYYEQFGQVVSWFLLNRFDNSLTLRPIFRDTSAHPFDPDQVIRMEPFVVRKSQKNFRNPETMIIDGFHIHVDFLPGQDEKAFALRDAYRKFSAEHGIIHSALDDYPEKANGPHLRAGWEVKFEKAGPTVFDRYGYSLTWLLLNHKDVPVYSHSKTWIYGENEERLISHLDHALYIGSPSELNQWFFYNPEIHSSGLYRWDSQLPLTRKPSQEESSEKQNQILTFWFGNEQTDYPYEQSKLWFSKQREAKNAEFDKLILDTFQKDLVLATMGAYSSWENTPKGKLALIILLDQFSRNMFRGTPMAFAYDRLALAIAKNGIENGDDKHLSYAERLFFYLPFTHSELIGDQLQGLELHTKLRDDVPEHLKEIFNRSCQSVKLHVTTVEKFGRLSSRNAILGRKSSAEEETFLQDPQNHF